MADSDFIEDPVPRAKVLREYPWDYSYHDWSLTILEIDPKIVLEKTPEWHFCLKKLCQTSGCERPLWGRDVEQPHHVLVLASMEICGDYDTDLIWAAMDDEMNCSPRQQLLSLNVPNHFPANSPEDLIIIEGDSSVVTHAYLKNVDILSERAIPQLSHENPSELVGCIRGITQEPARDTGRITIMLTWVGMKERSRSMDPMQHSYGGSKQYEQFLGRALSALRSNGARVETYLLQWQRWYPPEPKPASKLRCVIL